MGVCGARSPLAADGIQLVFDAEYRRDPPENNVDALQSQGLLSGSGGAAIGTEGATRLNEFFFESRVRIPQHQAFAESLSCDTAAYRYSDYSDGVQTDTYKFGLLRFGAGASGL